MTVPKWGWAAPSRGRAAVSYAAFGVLALIAWSVRADKGARPTVFVLDPEGLSVTALGLADGQVMARVGLQGQPERMVITPDASHILVLDRGPGKMTARFGYHPTGRSWATVLEARTLAVVARTELCWSVGTADAPGEHDPEGPWVFDDKGRQVVLGCLGYRSQKPEEALPRELLTLDLQTGQVTRRRELERPIDRLLAVGGGAKVAVYSGREAPKGQPAVPAELRFVDLGTLTVETTLALEGDPGPPTPSPDGRWLYLLEYGKPDKKPEKNVNGRVQVVSVERRAHQVNLEAGRAPRGLVVDDEGNQVFVLSEGEPSLEKGADAPGVLRVIRGAEEAAKITVGGDPLFLRVSPDRQHLHVVSEKTLTAVDLPALSKLGVAAPKPGGRSPLTGRAKELTVSSDGKRGYVLYDESSKLGILDLESRQLVAEVTTGRGGVKFGKLLGAAALSAASMSAAQAQANSTGFGWYSVYTVAPANTALVLSEDQRYVYVLNTRSNDVTIVDTETRQPVNKVGVGGAANRLELLPGGAFVAVTTGADTLHLIDTTTRLQASELPDGGNYVFSSDKRFAAAIGKHVVYCLEGATLKTLGTATGYKRPTQLLFEPPASRAR